MTILKTATGNQYYCDFFAKANPLVLYVKVQMDMDEALNVFQNPEETIHLQWYGDGGDMIREEYYFTKFTQITIMEGLCPMRIRLERDIDAVVQARMDEINSNDSV